MKSRKKEIPSYFLEKISEGGGRLTRAKREVLLILTNAGEPLSIKDVDNHSTVDTSSVYRVVEFFELKGILEKISYPDGEIRYALYREHHDHIICKKCFKTVHVPCSTGHTVKLSHDEFSSITEHVVTYYGVCAQCA